MRPTIECKSLDMPTRKTTNVNATILLNDGQAMPHIGFGTGQLNELTDMAVLKAIAAGYRMIDTATRYRNEARVGASVRASGVPREALFVTTKVWPDCFGHDATLRAFEESLERLGLDRVELYLLHWPAPWDGLYVESWRALIRLREEGRARSIGVSNFDEEQIRRLAEETGVMPAVNQVEVHPWFPQTQLLAFHAAQGIATQASSPLGNGRARGDPLLAEIGARYGKLPAQVTLRWLYQNGVAPIPKSASPAHIRANLDIFDFALGPEDLSAIASLESPDGRVGRDPAQFPR